jgi:transposase
MHKIGFSGNKTDKIDARRLLDVLCYYVHVKGISKLPSVYAPRPAVRRQRSLLSTYRLNRKIVNQLKNRIHSLFKQSGIATTKKKLFTNAGRKDAMRNVPPKLAAHVSLLCRQLAAANEAGDDLTDIIIDLGMKTFAAEIELLLSIPGFSVFTAIVLLADIDNVDRFNTPKKFCAYLRTAPRVKGSNTTTHIGSTRPQSRSITCTLLNQSVVHLKHAGLHFTTF